MAKEEDRFSGREKGIQAYHQALSAAAKKSRDQGSSAWKGRNARRIRQAREDRTLNRRPRWDERLGQGIANAGRDLGDMSVDIKEKITDWMPQGAKEKFAGIPHWFAQNLGRNFEEVEAAKRDDDEFTWGGDPIAADRGSPAYKFLLNQMEDKNAFREAVGDDKVFYTGLEEMSGDKYDASHPGLIALLNDPSRLKDMSPVRALNYMRSITGEPSNMGFDEFEALRQSQPDTYGGLDATGIAKQLLPEYYAQANDMYGQGFIGNTAAATYGDTSEVPAHIKQATGIPPVDIERLRLQGKGGHQDLTTIAPKADEIFDQTISANIAPANEILTESLGPTTPTLSAINYQEPNLVGDNILYGEPGNQPLNTMLQGIYPNYTPNPIFDELEDMNEMELLDWGILNPNEAEVLGFNPNYVTDSWID
jgi:hypothetical protein